MYTIFGSDNQEHGPVDATVLRRWIAEGRANAQTQAKGKGDANWRPLSAFPEFANDLPPGTSAYGSVAQPGAPMGMPGQMMYPGAMPVVAPTNGMAVAGMIMGILSLVLLCCTYGLPFNMLGIIFSAVALKQLKTNPLQQGRGMAIAGLIMSIIGSVLFLVLLVIFGAVGFAGAFDRW